MHGGGGCCSATIWWSKWASSKRWRNNAATSTVCFSEAHSQNFAWNLDRVSIDMSSVRMSTPRDPAALLVAELKRRLQLEQLQWAGPQSGRSQAPQCSSDWGQRRISGTSFSSTMSLAFFFLFFYFFCYFFPPGSNCTNPFLLLSVGLPPRPDWPTWFHFFLFKQRCALHGWDSCLETSI